ncbi:ent-kaurenoic acid oxidase 1-like [Actinidia eriantha]|uniref:ent-kaurenoic acid oxidase 1-like n=1 Tax=Actinidia eriantha TaxID=165200 RepID=UPI0025883A39|nr:ent-kaurenoic acid oxidase 1-like [Actinidia eriantha]
MEVIMGVWLIGVVPVVGWLLWWWNDLWYGFWCGGGGKLPPGHMGVPFFGEIFTFLYYFKLLRRPDDYINSKRQKYGDGVGMYRTHLFRSPAIISCSPSANKFVFQSDDSFILEWPTVEIVGTNSLVAVQGSAHARLRSFVSRAINQPDALRHAALMVQPRVIDALQSWAHKGRIVAFTEAKKVTFQNIGKLFANFEPGPVLDTLDELFTGMVRGIRAAPINFPGTAYHHAVQCRRKVEAIFREELKRRKKNPEEANSRNDLMDGLMQLKDDEGNQLRDIEVVDNIVSIVVAGYKSTSIAIMWALYYLAKYSDVLQKLREENRPISKRKNGELITSDDIANMKYTNKVVEETIRLANIAAIVFRTATKDVEYKGYKIPKGWKVMLWVRYLHTNPENFSDPMCFNPDRWNEPLKPGVYQVFGGGSRTCAGNMLARLQLAVFLHHLAVGYKWELVNPNAQMTYLPHPKPVDGVEIVISKLEEAK